jgi:hypothetical protein
MDQTLDHTRLRKAWALVKNGCVHHLGGTRFKVQGTQQPWYYVDLGQGTPCYCPDTEHRHNIACKHLLSARLASFDRELLDIVAEWIQEDTNG